MPRSHIAAGRGPVTDLGAMIPGIIAGGAQFTQVFQTVGNNVENMSAGNTLEP